LATAVALGFEKDVRFFADTFREMDLCTLKILHSMPTKTTEISEKVGNKMSLRVSEHVDFGFATFLFHDSESLGRGLQVKKASRFDHGRDNLEEGWIDVAAKRGSRGNCCILNTGALLQRWTGDFYNATAHRVIVPDEIAAMQHRYSCAFFMDPDGETVIKTPEEIRDKLIEQGVDVDKYPPLSCAEFLKMKINEMAVKQ
jgi:isopenicillin N synthase-like dioxygenase